MQHAVLPGVLPGMQSVTSGSQLGISYSSQQSPQNITVGGLKRVANPSGQQYFHSQGGLPVSVPHGFVANQPRASFKYLQQSGRKRVAGSTRSVVGFKKARMGATLVQANARSQVPGSGSSSSGGMVGGNQIAKAERAYVAKLIPMKENDLYLKKSCSRKYVLHPYPIRYEIFGSENRNDPRLGKVAELYFRMYLGTIPKDICELVVKGGKNRQFDFSNYNTVVLSRHIDEKEEIISACTIRVHANANNRCIEMLLFASDPCKHYAHGRLLLAVLGEIASVRKIPVILTCASVHTIGHWEQVGFSNQGEFINYWAPSMQLLTGQHIIQQVIEPLEYHHHSIAKILLGIPGLALKSAPQNGVIVVPNLEARIKKLNAQVSRPVFENAVSRQTSASDPIIAQVQTVSVKNQPAKNASLSKSGSEDKDSPPPATSAVQAPALAASRKTVDSKKMVTSIKKVAPVTTVIEAKPPVTKQVATKQCK